MSLFGTAVRIAAAYFTGGMSEAYGAGTAISEVDRQNDSKKAQRDANARIDYANAQNNATQREFAQNGIQWKVEDAKKAGIHPLYALGASTASPSFAFQPTGSVQADFGAAVDKGYEVMRMHQQQDISNLEAASRIKANEAQAARDFAMASASASDGARRKVGIYSDPVGARIYRTPIGNIGETGNYVDAQDLSDRYGDIVGEFGGLMNYLNDADLFGAGKFVRKNYDYNTPTRLKVRKRASYFENIPMRKYRY